MATDDVALENAKKHESPTTSKNAPSTPSTPTPSLPQQAQHTTPPPPPTAATTPTPATPTTPTPTPTTAREETTPAVLQDIYEELLQQCVEHAAFFKEDASERGQRLCAALTAWQDFIRLGDTLTRQVNCFAYKYDFDALTPGNGYRSFVTVTDACITYGREICRNLLAARTTMFFRKKFYMKEVESCSQLLSSLCTCLQYLLILHDWSCDSGDLFANGQHSAEELFEMGDTINQYCFYGRCLGFQYGDSIRGVLRFISIGMAGFSETFYAEEDDGPLVKTTRSVWTSGKYFLNPELRARRIVNISQNANIDFCKSFWFLAESELMHKIPSIVGSSIKVNRMIEIPAEPLQLSRIRKQAGKVPVTDVNQNDNSDKTNPVNKIDNTRSTIQIDNNLSSDNTSNDDNTTTSDNADNVKNLDSADNTRDIDNVEIIDIPVPSSHLGPGLPVSVRLLSYTRREGMVGEGGLYRGWRKVPPRSPSILFHCHGGGFVAQSSKSHELYLRDWAVALDVPILSVDYSLAPEAPFPRALEEVFYAYCWMLKNAEYLGTTAERIVLAGDSAGANLSIGVALKCIATGVRIPDGIFLAYCPTLISFVPSPARLLCLMDPLLPFGFMMRCLRAYAAPADNTLNENARHCEQLADIRNAAQAHNYKLHLETEHSTASSRRTSLARSTLSSLAENSKWEQIKLKGGASIATTSAINDERDDDDGDNDKSGADEARKRHVGIDIRNGDPDGDANGDGDGDDDAELTTEESSDTFASASYHSQTVERTDLPSADDDEDNSLCVSFEDDSQPIVHYPIDISAEQRPAGNSDSEQYIDRFLDKYLIDTGGVEAKEVVDGGADGGGGGGGAVGAAGTSGRYLNGLNPTIAKSASEENLLLETGQEMIAFDTIQGRFNNAVHSLTSTLSRYTQSSEIRNAEHSPHHQRHHIKNLRNMDALIARSPSVEFAFQVPKDPFLSPYWASDEWLSQLPSTKILTLDMDPCLDDCVMFGRKLKQLGRPVTLDILKGLPHGFLNFTMLSNEAMEGSKRCIKCLQELLQVPVGAEQAATETATAATETDPGASSAASTSNAAEKNA